MKILIADDHALNRNLLQTLLGSVYPEAKIFEAGDYDGTRQICAEHRPDLVLLDIAMPGHKGLCSVIEIVRKFPDTKVLVCSAIDNPVLIKTMLSFGVNGYVPKTMPADQLLEAVRQVLAGETFTPEGQHDNWRTTLTPRQAEILGLICTGLSNKEISEQLGISEHTVKLHVSTVLNTLGVKNRQQAVALCGLQ